ncbi:MAG: M20/M25/M40 family metallo-hydrolase [Chloroflexi bacterium]|nr:M20/M25/M40 family metallo-hydrolase [Chloroflexota bacterium]
MLKRFLIAFLLLLVLVLAVLGGLAVYNDRALYEGVVYYLVPAARFTPADVQPVDPAGRFASVYDLVRLRNQERMAYIAGHLKLPYANVSLIPIPGTPFSDVFVHFDSAGPFTLYCAHYDKAYDDVNYEGASDNTAAVSVLLAAVQELADSGDVGDRAFLFTGEEETGLHGATAFVEYARANHIAVRELVDMDSLGRGALAIRPSADQPGFMFSLPPVGDIAYDGSTFTRATPFPAPSARLTQALLKVDPNIVVLEQFTALSDSNVFQANGIDTVAISTSDMYYAQLAWDTYADKVELLDQQNLEKAYELILEYEN